MPQYNEILPHTNSGPRVSSMYGGTSDNIRLADVALEPRGILALDGDGAKPKALPRYDEGRDFALAVCAAAADVAAPL